MKAWIARDADGDLYGYDDEPIFIDEGMFVECLDSGRSYPVPNELFPELEPGYKQPIELTAVPLGPAEKGEAT